MAAQKRTPTEREEALAEVARLDRRGASQREIAKRLGVTQQQVSYDLRIIRERYAKETHGEHTAAVAEKIEQLREQRMELWEAWERSKAVKNKSVREKFGDITGAGKGKDGESADATATTKRFKTVTTDEGRLPEASYQRLILDNLREEAELLALYPPKRVAIGGDLDNPIPILFVEPRPASERPPNAGDRHSVYTTEPVK